MSGNTVYQLLGKLIKHGQILMLYPAAFETDAAKLSSEQYARLYNRAYNILYDEIELQASDGVTLRSFFLPYDQRKSSEALESEAAPPRATVIVFHGNGCHAWRYLEVAANFVRLGCNVLVLEYRGYGKSDGKPSEKGLRRDAQAALDYVLTDPILSQHPIVIHGHSLGGAVAIDLTSRNPSEVSALIVENTFLSVRCVARHMTKLSSLLWIHQKWDSASKIRKVPKTTPLLMLSGAQDRVVPPKHMTKLWEISRRRCDGKTDGKAKNALEGYQHDRFCSFTEGSHACTSSEPEYWDEVDEFLTKVLTDHSASCPSSA